MGYYMLDNPNPNTDQGVYPRRGGAKLSGTCIVHTSESVLDRIGPDSTAEDCAAFIGRRTGYGCYHDLFDSDSIIEMYPYDWETWQDSETNNWAVGISAAIRASEWLNVSPDQRDRIYRNAAKCGAKFVRYMRTKNIEVPRRRITGDEARARVPGFCAHGDSGLYRTDPGVQFDWALFFRYIEQELNGEEEMSLTPDQAAQLAYIASPDFKKHIFTGESEVERNARKAFIWELLNTDFPWYAFDGKQPTEGRAFTTIATDIGWSDARFAGTHNLIAAQTDIILEALAALPQISDDFIEDLRVDLAAALKAATDNLKVTLEVKPASE